MGYIVKPLVTEKMNDVTEKSSAEKTFRARSKATAEKYGAKEEKISYTYTTGKSKGSKQVSKEKTIYTYTRQGQAKYGFIVKPQATKLDIKNEVESLYKVTVTSVNTARYAGKRSTRYTKGGLVRGQRPSFKKAIVTLKAGDTIDFYSNI